MENTKRTIGPVTKGSGAGAALGLIIGYAVSHYLLPSAPAEIQEAVTTVIMFVGLLVGGWIVKPSTGKRRAE